MMPNEGKLTLLSQMVQQMSGYNTFRLAKSLPSPDPADLVLSDMDEADFDGYAAQNSIAFSNPILNGDNRGESESITITWTAGAGISGAQTIYGMYVTCNTIGVVERLWLWIPFTATITLSAPGQQVQKKLKLFDNAFTP